MEPRIFTELTLQMIISITGKNYERRTAEFGSRFSFTRIGKIYRGIENHVSPDYFWGIETEAPDGAPANGFFEVACYGGDNADDGIIGICLRENTPKCRAAIALDTGRVAELSGEYLDGWQRKIKVPQIKNERFETALPKLIRECERRGLPYSSRGL
jgi:hypothetical protein